MGKRYVTFIPPKVFVHRGYIFKYKTSTWFSLILNWLGGYWKEAAVRSDSKSIEYRSLREKQMAEKIVVDVLLTDFNQ